MSNDAAMRALIGLVAAWHRGDDEALRLLRPAEGEDSRQFYVAAFGTINHFADRVAGFRGVRPEDVLEHVRTEAPGTMMATIAEIAIAGLTEDAGRFNSLGKETSRDEGFIPSVFHLLVWLAGQIALATNVTTDAVLSDYAMTAAAGEAGMLGDD